MTDVQPDVQHGQVMASLGFTRASVGDLGPAELERVAAFLFGILNREPTKSSPGLQAERMVLGALAYELRTLAAEAGEPVGLVRDLRNAPTRAAEVRARQVLEVAGDQYRRSIAVDDITRNAREQQLTEDEALVERIARGEPPPAAPEPKIDDPIALL